MVDLLDSEKGFTFAAWRDLFLAVWRDAPTVAAANRLSAALSRTCAKHPRGVTTLVIIEQNSGMPDTLVRELMARDMKRFDTSMRSLVVVFEGTGFLASTVRSVLVGMQLLSRQTAPAKIFASVDEAAAWISRRGLAEPVTAQELITVVARARQSGSARDDSVGSRLRG